MLFRSLRPWWFAPTCERPPVTLTFTLTYLGSIHQYHSRLVASTTISILTRQWAGLLLHDWYVQRGGHRRTSIPEAENLPDTEVFAWIALGLHNLCCNIQVHR